MKTTILNQKKFPKPSEIGLHDNTAQSKVTFGKCEVELAAGRLVKFMRINADSWIPFTLKQLMDFYREMGWENDVSLVLYGIITPWVDEHATRAGIIYKPPVYLVQDEDGYFSVTSHFVKKMAGITKKRKITTH